MFWSNWNPKISARTWTSQQIFELSQAVLMADFLPDGTIQDASFILTDRELMTILNLYDVSSLERVLCRFDVIRLALKEQWWTLSKFCCAFL